MRAEGITFENEKGIALLCRIQRPADDVPAAWPTP